MNLNPDVSSSTPVQKSEDTKEAAASKPQKTPQKEPDSKTVGAAKGSLGQLGEDIQSKPSSLEADAKVAGKSKGPTVAAFPGSTGDGSFLGKIGLYKERIRLEKAETEAHQAWKHNLIAGNKSKDKYTNAKTALEEFDKQHPEVKKNGEEHERLKIAKIRASKGSPAFEEAEKALEEFYKTHPYFKYLLND